MSDTELRSGGLGLLDLDGKVAVITGGSSGIGAATATRLAQCGAMVIVGYNSGVDRAAEVVAGLHGSGHRALRIPIDDAAALADAVKEVEDGHGRCDVLINSAGSTRRVAHGDLDTMTPGLFESMLRINLLGPFAVTRAFTPLLTASGDGVIVNISSVSGTTAAGSNIAYCAAKAALDNLTMSLGRALGPEVRVIGIAPAAVETGFVAGRGRDAIAQQAATTPLRVLVHPDDIATSVLAAVTHLRVATGTTLMVDGGKHL